jgi:hypothetical protein
MMVGCVVTTCLPDGDEHFFVLRLLPMSDRDKDAEILALRHQLAVLQRQLGNEKARFTAADRAFLAALLHRLPREALRRLRLLVRPDTILRWRRHLIAWRHAAMPTLKRDLDLTLKKASLAACSVAFQKSGYRPLKTSNAFVQERSPGVLDWVGLNLKTSDLPRSLGVNPTIGVRHEKLESEPFSPCASFVSL